MLYIRHMMIRTQVYLPKTLYQELSLVARREKKAKAQVIRESLERALKEAKTETVGEAFLKLAEVGKKLRLRGPKDLSTNHDKYLYEDL